MRAQHLTAFVLPIALVSCTGRPARSPAAAADTIGGYAERAERQQVAWLKRAANALPAVAAARADLSSRFAIRAGDATPSMIIRSGQASIEVDSLEPAVATVRALAGRVGGYVANTTMQTGRGQLRSASLEVKIPADRFEEALTGLAPIGKLESVNVSAEDVGEEYVDVAARMANARRLESRLIDLLAARTGKLKDVLDVEQELARVREEIERYEGRLRYLKAHAAFSTLTISVHEPVPVVGQAGASVMGEAFKQAWRNFVDLAAAGVRSLGFVIPLALVGALAWLGTRRWRKARTPHAAAA
jgi:hypothetical protein